MAIERVGVVGFGQMGSGIAQVCAAAGLDVLARDVDRLHRHGRIPRLRFNETARIVRHRKAGTQGDGIVERAQ